MMTSLTCFKAYDIRGELGSNLDTEICYRIGRATAVVLKLKSVVIGYDVRESSLDLSKSTSQGFMDEGVDILNIGMAGTEEMYSATYQFKACAGVEITASHNPINYNGMKIVKSSARPLHPLTEFKKIKSVAEKNSFSPKKTKGKCYDISKNARQSYIKKVLSFIEFKNLRPLSIVINSGNGAAGPTFDALEDEIFRRKNVLSFVRMHHEPDATFPNGIPNPLLEQNRKPTQDKVKETSADFGVAFDGDFDRCFFFDEKGQFVPSEYIVGLLASSFINKEPGASIVHDPRIIWNTQDIVMKLGGVAIQSKTGHGFIKQTMRNCKALYGGEMSAHHYFRDFAFCDSGMIPWLLVAEVISITGEPLSKLINKMAVAFPSSGEINFKVSNPKRAIKKVMTKYVKQAIHKDTTDGISLNFENWRFNIRISNTEPLIRLNTESRGNPYLIQKHLDEIKAILIS